MLMTWKCVGSRFFGKASYSLHFHITNRVHGAVWQEVCDCAHIQVCKHAKKTTIAQLCHTLFDTRVAFGTSVVMILNAETTGLKQCHCLLS